MNPPLSLFLDLPLYSVHIQYKTHTQLLETTLGHSFEKTQDVNNVHPGAYKGKERSTADYRNKVRRRGAACKH